MLIHSKAAEAVGQGIITYPAAGTSIMLWGLHVSELAAIVSAAAAVVGLVLQFYVARQRLRILRKANAQREINDQ